MKQDNLIAWLKANADERNRCGMGRFGIEISSALGVSMATLRSKAKEIGCDHKLAMELYDTNIHEARLLASIVADPALFEERDMDRWTAEFCSWDVCDQSCMNLFRHTPYAYRKVREYAESEREFTRRTGFTLLATLAVADKVTEDAVFSHFLPLVRKYSTDERNFVRKAVNWALRQIGKRSCGLLAEATAVAEGLVATDDRTARWIGRDALREFSSPKIIARIEARSEKVNRGK